MAGAQGGSPWWVVEEGTRGWDAWSAETAEAGGRTCRGSSARALVHRRAPAAAVTVAVCF